ncbi:transcriptional activator RfaH [Thiomicrospira sp. R3]|uniref:transcriptional activator RfaH n=1 Tax=Thiomicrospira sp. R3 TaxID=3035472 RepID=UPI00259B3174|nr:transcriptional activator RfaH [Thiomicrospira sp. R3]WFE68775.1 transcriptional activator RfaH [Thiomicrospira sp. R3]
MNRWYLIMTKPKQDALAEQNLTQQGYQVYSPKIKLQTPCRGKMRPQIHPLFPRYLFIQLCDENQNWAPIRSTKGVWQIVRFGNHLPTLDDAIIGQIQKQEAQQLETQGLAQLKNGDGIRIETGPFYGQQALYVATA